MEVTDPLTRETRCEENQRSYYLSGVDFILLSLQAHRAPDVAFAALARDGIRRAAKQAVRAWRLPEHNMHGYLGIAFLLTAVLASVDGMGRGRMPSSFQAMGQSYTLSECSPEKRASEPTVATAFRESYREDPGTKEQRAALVVDLGTIQTMRFLQDSALNETVQITGKRCSRVDMDALAIEVIHLLRNQNDSQMFPIRQMLTMPEPNERPTKGTCRGQPCVTWTVRQAPVKRTGADGTVVETSDVYTIAWTDFADENSWSSMSRQQNVPLELRLCRKEKTTQPGTKSSQTTEQYSVIEIMYFTPGDFIADDLEYPDGVYCENFVSESWKLDESSMNYLSYSAEVSLDRKKNRTVANSVVYMYMPEKLYRIDFTPETANFNNVTIPKKAKSISRIISGTHGFAFDIESLKSGKTRCRRRQPEALPFMREAIIDFRDVPSLSPQLFFGTNQTNYLLKKKTQRRGIPCNLWQGRRNDWPPKQNITTVWEWCVGELKDQPTHGVWGFSRLPLVSLEIYYPHVDDSAHNDEGSIESWQKLTFSFYRAEQGKWVADLRAFDVTDCMDGNVYPMQFELKYPENKYEDVVKITIEPFFLATCKIQILRSLKTTIGTLRIGKLRAMFDADRMLYIQFDLLNQFPPVKGEPELKDMEASLQKDVDHMRLKIKMKAPGSQEEIEFTAVPRSLREVDSSFSASNAPSKRSASGAHFRSEGPYLSDANLTRQNLQPALLRASQVYHAPAPPKKESAGQSETPHHKSFVATVLVLVGVFFVGAFVGVVSLRVQKLVK